MKKNVALITCVNHSDYLRFTLPFNRWYFDDVYILTSHRDNKVHHLAGIFNCKLFITNKFYENGTFNRGAAIHDFLQSKKEEIEWVTHIDSDIILINPIKFKDLNPNFLYGQKRLLVYTVKDFYDLLFQRKSNDKFECPQDSGWGYLQIFNTSTARSYPCNFSGCRDSDSVFRSSFENNITLHDYCIHLGPHGQNHFNRVTKEFVYEE